MATTSLPDELKQLATTAAQELGLSTHSFLVGATHQVADAVEQRSQFIAQGRAARAEILHSGLGHDASDVRTYLRGRLTNDQLAKPEAKPWHK